MNHGSISQARRTAFRVLLLTHEGGYAADLLVLLTKDLDTRDAGLTSEIVFGCLRYQAQLDFLIDARLRQPSLDPEVRIALRMGAYQIRYLDRVPAYAAVGESVELVRRAGKHSAAGLVNAILRKVDRRSIRWPDRATELSCPPWLLERWDAQYGAETASQIARSFLNPAEATVAATGRIQDIGSQSVVPLLEIEPGQTFLDVCAAPGNKTAQAIASGALAIACDRHLRRLGALADLPCPRVALDATRPLPFRAQFDRILVDVPCSGTGTLDRNPEIKWKLKPEDLKDFQARQIAILRNAVALAKPGGRLVYSTCSLEREENEDVLAAVPGAWETHRRMPGIDPGNGFFAAVLAL